MAKEYIDREVILNCIEKDGRDGEYDLGYAPHNIEFMELIKELPAADVRENVMARWTVVSKDCEFADGSKAAWNVWICPICGYERTAGWEYTSPGEKPKAKLCEMCGAQMGGTEDD